MSGRDGPSSPGVRAVHEGDLPSNLRPLKLAAEAGGLDITDVPVGVALLLFLLAPMVAMMMMMMAVVVVVVVSVAGLRLQGLLPFEQLVNEA